VKHNLENVIDPLDGAGLRCSVCLKQWKHAPRSECIGLPWYAWHAPRPDHLVLPDSLFRKGLKLAEDQQPVARVGTGNDPLYDIGACVPHEIKIDFDQGKYKFIDTDLGFDIWRENGLHVRVHYEDTYLHIQEAAGARSRFGLYAWQEARSQAAYEFAYKVAYDDVETAQDYISKALSNRFYLGWRRIINEIVPADILALQRLMFSSIQGDCALLHNAELYTDVHQHTRADLVKYHACRLYAGSAASLDGIAHWRERLAPTVPNKALNKTLDKMPRAISYRQIFRLSTIQLTEPVTDRLHLIFILCASDHHNWGLHERTVVSATPQMVQQAAAVFGRTLNSRSKTVVIGDVARSILDYDQPYAGDLLGLARRSHAWHGEMDLRPTLDFARELSAETPLVAPTSVDLAALEEVGITLLKTAGDCYKEHVLMQHCIHTYASKAQAGLCYLFHVEYEKPGADRRVLATVEVSPAGIVVQAKGPHNEKNPACEYGVKVINEAFKKGMKV
jgi:hypothetical protein